MNDTIECKRCGSICQIEGEFPKFFAWCDTCNDYADADSAVDEYTADYLAAQIDKAHERSKWER